MYDFLFAFGQLIGFIYYKKKKKKYILINNFIYSALTLFITILHDNISTLFYTIQLMNFDEILLNEPKNHTSQKKSQKIYIVGTRKCKSIFYLYSLQYQSQKTQSNTTNQFINHPLILKITP